MTFRLTVDGPRWSRSLRNVLDATPGLVPVIKGNAYGFGATLAARAAAALGVSTVAVGTTAEIPAVRSVFDGRILVLEPLAPGETVSGDVLRTVARADELLALAAMPAPPAVVLELDSPVHRYGLRPGELAGLAPALARVPLAGFALHLPIGGDRRRIARSTLTAVRALREAGLPPNPLWVSHLTRSEVAVVRARVPGLAIRQRIGTGFWLADRASFQATGSVLDTRPVGRRELVGYRQRRPGPGTVVVVSGGTAHGVGLHATPARSGTLQTLRAAAAGAAHGAGLTPSPFHWQGRRLSWADGPHMQVSMLFVPAGTAPPRIGDRLPCDVRMTVTTFDETVISPVSSSFGMTPEAIGPASAAPRTILPTDAPFSS